MHILEIYRVYHLGKTLRAADETIDIETILPTICYAYLKSLLLDVHIYITYICTYVYTYVLFKLFLR